MEATRRAMTAWRDMTGDRAERGISLIDVMVAMLILSIAVLGLAASVPLAGSAVQNAWQQSQTAAVAEGVFEQMRVTAYANITAANFPNVSAVPSYSGLSYTINFADNTPVASTKTVTITVTYTTRQGPANAQFSTIFAAQ